MTLCSIHVTRTASLTSFGHRELPLGSEEAQNGLRDTPPQIMRIHHTSTKALHRRLHAHVQGLPQVWLPTQPHHESAHRAESVLTKKECHSPPPALSHRSAPMRRNSNEAAEIFWLICNAAIFLFIRRVLAQALPFTGLGRNASRGSERNNWPSYRRNGRRARPSPAATGARRPARHTGAATSCLARP